MEMYFVTSKTISNLLFKDLNINDTKELVGACIITFLATVIFEGMKLLKVYLSIRQNENPLDGVQNLHSQERIDASSTHDEAILLSSLRFPATVRQIRFQKILLHVINTVTHMINFFYGYMLMLLVMTYNVWLTLAVIIGSGVGYFIFGALGQTLQIHYRQLHKPNMTDASDNHSSVCSSNPDEISGHL